MPMEFARRMVEVLFGFKHENPTTVFNLSKVETVFKERKKTGRFQLAQLRPPPAVHNLSFSFTLPVEVPKEAEAALNEKMRSEMKAMKARLRRRTKTKFEHVDTGTIRTLYFTSKNLKFINNLRAVFEEMR